MGIEHRPRTGLATYKLKSTRGRLEARICENVTSGHNIVGFSSRGDALWECDDILEAISVPDVAIIRIRELAGLGYRFVRVEMKAFKVSDA